MLLDWGGELDAEVAVVPGPTLVHWRCRGPTVARAAVGSQRVEYRRMVGPQANEPRLRGGCGRADAVMPAEFGGTVEPGWTCGRSAMDPRCQRIRSRAGRLPAFPSVTRRDNSGQDMMPLMEVGA